MSSLLLALSFPASFNHFAPVAKSHCLQILLLQPFLLPPLLFPSCLSTERYLDKARGLSLTKSEFPTEPRLNSEWPDRQLLSLSVAGWQTWGWRSFHLSFRQFKHPSVWLPPETLHKCTFTLCLLVASQFLTIYLPFINRSQLAHVLKIYPNIFTSPVSLYLLATYTDVFSLSLICQPFNSPLPDRDTSRWTKY